jgi:hypothetical protein
MIDKLVDLKMLVVKRSSRGQQGINYHVLPHNAYDAQTVIRNDLPARGPGAMDHPSSSPSSTIAADTPVFKRNSGSRNRIMASSAAPSPAPTRSIDTQVMPAAVPEGPLALDASPPPEDENEGDEMEGLSTSMQEASIQHRDNIPSLPSSSSKPRRTAQYGRMRPRQTLPFKSRR